LPALFCKWAFSDHNWLYNTHFIAGLPKRHGKDQYDNSGINSLKNWLIINELFNKNYHLSNGVFFVLSLA
jgi:hypothetical protein